MIKHRGFCGKEKNKNIHTLQSAIPCSAPTPVSEPYNVKLKAGVSRSICVNGGGSNSNSAPLEYSSVQIYHAWYNTKEDKVRLCATWYKSESCSNIKLHLVFTSSFPSFYWYFGNWNKYYSYGVGAIVRYSGEYYRCIKEHRGSSQIPTNTSYWKQQGFPDLSNWYSASATDGVYVPDRADYITTLSDLEEGALYADYLYSDYEGMYCFYTVTYDNGSDEQYSVYNWTSKIDFNRLNTTPSVSYNNSTNRIQVSSSSSGEFLMEFYRSGFNPTGYSESVRNEFFLTSIAALENGLGGYYYIENRSLYRWKRNKTYTVGIRYLDKTNQSTLYNAINDAIWELNQIMSEFGITFKKIATTSYANTSGDITFICGSHKELFGEEPTFQSGWYNGRWETSSDSDGYIKSATIKLRNDGEWHCTYKSVAMEELLQTMGAGYDQIEYIDNTIHSEFIYLNKPDYITSIDKNILRITYSNYIDAGMSAETVAVNINPTNGATNITNNQKLSFLTPGCTYYIKVYVVNMYGKISYPRSLTINVPLKSRPTNFSWTYSKTSGGTFNLTAAEWNSFTSRINEFREYCDLSNYSFTTAYQGNTFTAAMYRQARTAIQAIDGYGGRIPYVSSGDEITAYMMNVLVSELNTIP